jgi:hypothetical protein
VRSDASRLPFTYAPHLEMLVETIAPTPLLSGIGTKGALICLANSYTASRSLFVSAPTGFSVFRQRSRGSHGQGNDLSQTC